jgi:zinc D-Ala-D-Ala carboxypeptidase
MSWENFSLEEFACKHCGENKIEHELIDKLQLLRSDVGFPFKITSGYRCADHPIEKVKSEPGTHALGLAADILLRGEQALEVISKATDYGFTGIGINQKGNARFIHLDISKDSQGRPRPHVWSY